MKQFWLVLFMLTIVAGCSRKEESGVVAAPALAQAPAQTLANAPGKASRYLAYQHTVHIDTEEHKIAAIFEAAQATCRDIANDLCTVLESRINTGREASASLTFRAAPSGIRKLIAALSQQSDITNQSTNAEDLAAPMEDSAKKLALLNDYRSKLEALRSSAKTDVDALIKVNKELSQVQSDIEATARKNAQLVQRVETEILSVSISSVQNRRFWKPISLALEDFGADLSQGVAIAITAMAYLIPWALVLLLASWIGRRLWLSRKKPKTNA
jgi:hypothetical protein